MKGQCRFLKTEAGITFFARAWVDAEAAGSGAGVENALPEATEAGSGEVARRSEPSWVEAALDGMRAVSEYTHADGEYRLRLIRLVGTAVDTRADVVRCAAALAAWQALGVAATPPEPQFDGREWTLAFPAPAARAVAEVSP